MVLFVDILSYYFYIPRNQTTSCQYKLSKRNNCSAV